MMWAVCDNRSNKIVGKYCLTRHAIDSTYGVSKKTFTIDKIDVNKIDEYNVKNSTDKGSGITQIIAWECNLTGEIFKSKEKYKRHLCGIASKRRQDKVLIEHARQRDVFFATMRETCRSTDDITQFIINNWTKFCNNAIDNSWQANAYTKPYPTLEAIEINARWRENVSNSHCSPLTGVTNWSGEVKSAPTSYSGWYGKITYQTSDTNTYEYEFDSKMWKHTGINTGTGGYAGGYYYEFSIFEDDWPAMAEINNKARVWKQLKNDTRSIEEIARDLIKEENE
jgi:hypothetical protein